MIAHDCAGTSVNSDGHHVSESVRQRTYRRQLRACTGGARLLAARPFVSSAGRVYHIPVGSRTGAPLLGSGGCSNAFAVALRPAAIITFPAPAASNVACEFLALRSPVRFVPMVYGTYAIEVIFRSHAHLVAGEQPQLPRSHCALHWSHPSAGVSGPASSVAALSVLPSA